MEHQPISPILMSLSAWSWVSTCIWIICHDCIIVLSLILSLFFLCSPSVPHRMPGVGGMAQRPVSNPQNPGDPNCLEPVVPNPWCPLNPWPIQVFPIRERPGPILGFPTIQPGGSPPLNATPPFCSPLLDFRAFPVEIEGWTALGLERPFPGRSSLYMAGVPLSLVKGGEPPGGVPGQSNIIAGFSVSVFTNPHINIGVR